MKPLHEELKELRLEQNLTLKDVALRTRIRLDFLERIEDGDYSVVPMPFVRAFFREYAEVVGVDATLVMAKLDKKIDTILAPKPAEHEVSPKAAANAGTAAETGADGADTDNPVPPEPAGETITADGGTPAADEDGDEDGADAKEDPAADAQASLFGTGADAEAGDDGADEKDGGEGGLETVETVCPEPEPAVSRDKRTAPAPAMTTVPHGDHEVELGENGAASGTVRRPLVIEEERSISNIVFAAIVIGILIAAGVLMYLNRGTLF